MNIVYDVSYVQRRLFGIGRSSRELLRALLQADRADNFLLHGWSWSIDRTAIETLAGGRAECSLMRLPGPVKRFYWNTLRIPKVEALIGRFDLFHSADPFLPPTRCATVATVHDFAYLRFPEFFPFDRRAMHSRIIRSLERATALAVPSGFTMDELRDVAPSLAAKATVVPWPIAPQFCPATEEGGPADELARLGLLRPYILAVGTLEPRKNLAALLDAMQLLWSQEHMKLQLVIAGREGWMNRELLQRIRQLQREGRVRYLGGLAEEDLPRVYRHAAVAVYPSLYEGFGLPVLEAMASGTPVITSNNSALREIGEGAALLVDPRDPASLAGAIRRAVEDSGLRKRMRENGLAKAALYSHERAASQMLGVYSSLKSQ